MQQPPYGGGGGYGPPPGGGSGWGSPPGGGYGAPPGGYGPPPGGGYGPPGGGYGAPPPGFDPMGSNLPPQTSTLAIVSLVCGILGLTCCGLLSGAPAIICGFMARQEIERSPSTQGANMALAGIILGFLSIGYTALAVMGGFLNAIFRGFH